jgi:hypothetical protein
MEVLKKRIGNKIKETESYEKLNDEEKNKLLSHIIGKGEGFYNMVYNTTDIISYLIDKKIYADFNKIFDED